MKKEDKLKKITEKYIEDVKELLENKKDSGLVVMAIDGELEDGKSGLFGGAFGNRVALTIGMSKLMENNKNFCRMMKESVEFYKFKDRPLKSLMNMLEDLIEEIDKEVKDAPEDSDWNDNEEETKN